ncbi:MAG: hypothetical protein FD143_3126 [Ignavibacteria bacterium]|nr:MAG: hypothetical protein FD143_3126 [Ignavibacteria bacterium]
MLNSGLDNTFHFEVLDGARQNRLAKLAHFKDTFYLAGGTALALQIGHRISVDFDFFAFDSFVNEKLILRITELFHENKIEIIQNEINTVTAMLDDEIKLSFFYIKEKNIFSIIDTEYFKLAQIKEIGIMKLLALFRATYKDYIDIYFILQHCSLTELIEAAQKKHPDFNKTIYIKALLSYDDIDNSPITFIEGCMVEKEIVFNYLEKIAFGFIKESG